MKMDFIKFIFNNVNEYIRLIKTSQFQILFSLLRKVLVFSNKGKLMITCLATWRIEFKFSSLPLFPKGLVQQVITRNIQLEVIYMKKKITVSFLNIPLKQLQIVIMSQFVHVQSTVSILRKGTSSQSSPYSQTQHNIYKYQYLIKIFSMNSCMQDSCMDGWSDRQMNGYIVVSRN